MVTPPVIDDAEQPSSSSHHDHPPPSYSPISPPGSSELDRLLEDWFRELGGSHSQPLLSPTALCYPEPSLSQSDVPLTDSQSVSSASVLTPDSSISSAPSSHSVRNKFDAKYKDAQRKITRRKRARPVNLDKTERKILLEELKVNEGVLQVEQRLATFQRNLYLLTSVDKILVRLEAALTNPLSLFTENL